MPRTSATRLRIQQVCNADRTFATTDAPRAGKPRAEVVKIEDEKDCQVCLKLFSWNHLALPRSEMNSGQSSNLPFSRLLSSVLSALDPPQTRFEIVGQSASNNDLVPCDR